MASSTVSGTVNYAQLTTEQRLFYEMNMLTRAVSNFPHLYFGLQGSVHPVTTLPENKGHQIQWSKLSAFPAVTDPLTDGVTPDPQDITVSTVTGTVNEYGAFIRYSKSLAEMGIHKIAAEASDAMGEQSGDSLDQITRAVLVAETTNVQRANGRSLITDILSTDVFTLTEAMKAATTLRVNKAVGPLANGRFPAVIHPNTCYDLYQDPVFQAILSYSKERGENNPWISGHVGDAFGLSYYESPNAYVNVDAGDSSTDVYSSLILGKGSFGVGGLAAYMPTVMAEDQEGSVNTFKKVQPLRLINKDFGETGSADPFNRYASIAWYTTFLAKVLDANFYVRIEHATALGS